MAIGFFKTDSPAARDMKLNAVAKKAAAPEVNDLTAAVTWDDIPDANVPESAVTQHQAALSITESQISDLGSYLTAETNDLSAAVTWANIPDANVSESAVTQHEAALTVTESQISDLGSYLVTSNDLSDLNDAVTAIQNLGITNPTSFNLTIGGGANAAITTGTYNIAIGENAHNDATTANKNIAIGAEALSKVTVAAGLGGLIAIGAEALSLNTTGTYNVAIGLESMKVNTSGSYNTGIGIQTLLDNTTGSRNLALGAWALYDNTTGSDNSAVGYGSMFKAKGAAEGNTGVGVLSLFEVVTGDLNTGIGANALKNTTGSYSTGVGSNALLNATTGDGNVAIGVSGGDNITTASRCITIGYFIDTPSDTADYQMSIGNAIFGTNIDGVTKTISTGKIGLFNTAPSGKLHVDQPSTTGAIPVLTLEQNDVSEEMIEFDTTIGTGNAIEAVGSKTLTTTHFIKVTIPGGLTRHFPIGTIA